ncbi:MAG: helix-turn-helix domain-containing protein [Chloroflexota bacterium]|nr:helix-turn-helix domain-containing protein [Chloroflexota bacterium]
MRKALPPIREDAETLKQLLQREHDGRRKPRLQMLYLLASGQAGERQEVARLLGVHRNTIGRWLALYHAGGLDGLLEIYVPAGKQHSVPSDIQRSIGKALEQPQGFASYQALRQWVKQTHQRDITYHTLYRLVRSKFNAKLKVPRPSYTKKP